MLKVMIIDDESLVRAGLKSMINWDELGFEIAGEAANGQTGLDQIICLKPDIVLTDIKMPVMDGLDMMARAIKANCQAKFIILSGYDQFQLVKQAMKQGAEEYLIKLDLEPETLVNVLTAVREKIAEENGKTAVGGQLEKGLRENLAILREGFFKRLISRRIRDINEIQDQVHYLQIKLQEDFLACAVVRMNNRAVLEKYNAEELRSLEATFLQTIDEIINDIFLGYTLHLNPGEFVVVFSVDTAAARGAFPEKAVQMSERLVQVLKQYFNISVSIGVSSIHQGFSQLPQVYLECSQALQYSFFSTAGPVQVYETIPKVRIDHDLPDWKALESSLPKAIESHDIAAVQMLFRRIGAYINEKTIPIGQAYDICFRIVYLIGGTLGFHETVVKEIIGYQDSVYESVLMLDTLPEICNWLMYVEEGLNKYLLEAEEQRNHRLIAKAKKYIMEHYSEEISLNDVASALGISQSYFSTIFKQYAGVNFTDYVTRIKMDHAKKLLRESDYKIYEISEMLGYQNAYYFSKVFKKVTGMTPSEFCGK